MIKTNPVLLQLQLTHFGDYQTSSVAMFCGYVPASMTASSCECLSCCGYPEVKQALSASEPQLQLICVHSYGYRAIESVYLNQS